MEHIFPENALKVSLDKVKSAVFARDGIAADKHLRELASQASVKISAFNLCVGKLPEGKALFISVPSDQDEKVGFAFLQSQDPKEEPCFLKGHFTNTGLDLYYESVNRYGVQSPKHSYISAFIKAANRALLGNKEEMPDFDETIKERLRLNLTENALEIR